MPCYRTKAKVSSEAEKIDFKVYLKVSIVDTKVDILSAGPKVTYACILLVYYSIYYIYFCTNHTFGGKGDKL